MQRQVIPKVSLSIFSLIVSTLFLVPLLPVQSAKGNPNGSSRKPEPGWTLWRPESQIQSAGFTAGFSNIELGGYLDFENACKTEAESAKSKAEYWFRLSNSVERIGTGIAEFGCWMNGRFLVTHTSTAVKSSLENVDCLRVKSPTGNGLVIRAEPSVKARRVGVVANGSRVDPGSFPASIIEVDGRNWVAIRSPKEGWISDDSFTSQGNLTLCKR